MKILSLLTIPAMVSPLCSAFAVPLATQGNKVITTQNLQQRLKVAGLLNNPVKQLKAFMNKDNYALNLNHNYFNKYWTFQLNQNNIIDSPNGGGYFTRTHTIDFIPTWTSRAEKDSNGYYILPLLAKNSISNNIHYDTINTFSSRFNQAAFDRNNKFLVQGEMVESKSWDDFQGKYNTGVEIGPLGTSWHFDTLNWTGYYKDPWPDYGWWANTWADQVHFWDGTNTIHSENAYDIFKDLTLKGDTFNLPSFGIAKYGFGTVDLEQKGYITSGDSNHWLLKQGWNSTDNFIHPMGQNEDMWLDKNTFDMSIAKNAISSAAIGIKMKGNLGKEVKDATILTPTEKSNIGVLYYDVRNLIQLDSVGFDKEQQKYFTTTGLNENLIVGTLGMKYNRDFIDNVYNRDFSNVYQDDKGVWHVKSRSEATNLLLNNCFYYHDILGMTNIGGGVQTWADENIVSSGEYASWMGALKNILADLIDNHYCCYDNYFAIKRYVQDYVKEHLQLPNLDALIHEIKEGKLKTNGWYDFADQYGLDETSLDALCLILPQLKLSEWNMDAETTASAFNNAGFNNIEQTNYIGRREEPITHTKYSTGLDLFEPNCNKYYLQTTSTEGEDIVYLHNVKNLDVVYEKLNKVISVEPSDTAEDIGGMVNVTTLKGLDRISQQTAGAVYETTASFTSSTGTHNDLGAIGIKKNGVIIANVEEAEKQGLFAQVDVKENLLASRSDDVWAKALSDAGGDTIKALKSIYINNIINDPQPALPFVEINLYDNDSYEFDLDTLGDRRLEVSADGHLGTLTTNLVAADGSVISTYTTHGFDTSDHPQPIIDPTTGLSPGAIAGITIGSIAGASALAFGGYKGVKFAKFKKKEKEFNSKK